jgi:hypothetical protein
MLGKRVAGTLASMTEQERTLIIANLALAHIQTNIEFAFYKKQLRLGEMDFTGHPDFAALDRQFAPLVSELERAKAQGENTAEDLYSLLREVLTATNTLRKP